MRRTQDTSSLRLLAQLKLHTREASSTASCSCQTSIQWCHQRFSSEPRSTTQTSTSLAEFAWTFSRTSGPQPFKSDPSSCPSRPWCPCPTWMIPWTKRLPMPGKLTRRVPSREPRSGPCNTLTTERQGYYLLWHWKGDQIPYKAYKWSSNRPWRIAPLDRRDETNLTENARYLVVL